MTILDYLKRSRANLSNVGFIPLARANITTAVTLLEKGYKLSDDADELIATFGTLDEVPYTNNNE